MPMKWNHHVRKNGHLKVFNKGGSWSAAVDTAIATFNSLGFGVNLVRESDEEAADVVVVVGNSSADTYSHKKGHATATKLKPKELHGLAWTRATSTSSRRPIEIDFAVIFLPGGAPNPTPKQKEVIAVHEFIHASGLSGALADGREAPGGDHDTEGIMYPQMAVSGDGLIEYLHDGATKPMTPIRVGAKTRCLMRMLWTSEVCELN